MALIKTQEGAVIYLWANTFVDSKYSYVACDGEQIFGVVLADSFSKINYDEILIEALAVANNLQGYGIGEKLFEQIWKKVLKKRCIILNCILNETENYITSTNTGE